MTYSTTTFRTVLFAAAFAVSAALSCQAATITSFVVTPAAGSVYLGSETLNSVLSANVARLTNSSVTCPATTTGCSGIAALYTLTGTGLTGATPFGAAIDGTLSGTTSAAGSLNVNLTTSIGPFFSGSIPFSVSSGSFSTTIVPSTSVPGTPDGAFTVSGSLGLTLAAGQTINLPSSLDIYVGSAASSVPEPASFGMLGLGLVGLAGLKRRRA